MGEGQNEAHDNRGEREESRHSNLENRCFPEAANATTIRLAAPANPVKAINPEPKYGFVPPGGLQRRLPTEKRPTLVATVKPVTTDHRAPVVADHAGSISESAGIGRLKF